MQTELEQIKKIFSDAEYCSKLGVTFNHTVGGSNHFNCDFVTTNSLGNFILIIQGKYIGCINGGTKDFSKILKVLTAIRGLGND